jgi:hypothetical protein
MRNLATMMQDTGNDFVWLIGFFDIKTTFVNNSIRIALAKEQIPGSLNQ